MAPASSKAFVFVGLGNPGPEYEMTRHNAGFLVVRSFASQAGWHFKEEKRFNAFVAKGLIDGQAVHLILPLTYMNRSGLAVKSYLDFYKLGSDCLTVVVDDISLPFGKLKLKPAGSAGGHNGLKSIECFLATASYMRLKMGIGHPGKRILADYVLEPFSSEELQHLMGFVDHGVHVLKCLMKESTDKVMKMVNTTPPKEV